MKEECFSLSQGLSSLKYLVKFYKKHFDSAEARFRDLERLMGNSVILTSFSLKREKFLESVSLELQNIFSCPPLLLYVLKSIFSLLLCPSYCFLLVVGAVLLGSNTVSVECQLSEAEFQAVQCML